MKVPKRTPSHIIDQKCVNLIRTKFCEEGWIVREQNERDYGIDLHVERFEESMPTGDLIFIQLKGTQKEFEKKVKLQNFGVKTINYALLFNVPFFVFYVSIKTEEVKYVWLQEYADLILDKENQKWRDQDTVTIRFPYENDMDTYMGMKKIIAISSFEKRIKMAHKYVMLYEHFCVFNKALGEGDKNAAKVCLEILYKLQKNEAIKEFGGGAMLARDEAGKKAYITKCMSIYESIARNGVVSDDEIKFLKHLVQSLEIGKQNALNMEMEKILRHYLHGMVPY